RPRASRSISPSDSRLRQLTHGRSPSAVPRSICPLPGESGPRRLVWRGRAEPFPKTNVPARSLRAGTRKESEEEAYCFFSVFSSVVLVEVFLPLFDLFLVVFFLAVDLPVAVLVELFISVVVDWVPVTGFVEDFVSLVIAFTVGLGVADCAKTPVGNARATVRASMRNRAFFISYSFRLDALRNVSFTHRNVATM